MGERLEEGFRLRAAAAEIAAWKAAAEREGVKTSEFVRRAANDRANPKPIPPPIPPPPPHVNADAVDRPATGRAMDQRPFRGPDPKGGKKK